MANFNRSIYGTFGRGQDAPTLGANASIIGDGQQVTLNVGGEVEGSMTPQTAHDLGSAFIAASGMQATAAPAPVAQAAPASTAKADAHIPSGSYAEWDAVGEVIRLYLPNGAQIAAFTEQTRYVVR